MPSCDICVEPLNKSNHAPSTCNFCSLTACKQCIRTFLTSSVSEPKCMKCNTAWDNEFVLKSVNKTYYHSELKDKKKEKYLEFEKGRIPATQEDAKRFLIKEQAGKEIAAIDKINDELMAQINKNKRIAKGIRQSMHDRLVVTEKKQFIMPCQADGCKGFLSTGYKCELCDLKTCSKCLEILEEEHECKPESIASAEMIRKETKPCPKCATPTYKIDGCSQMWCVKCNTPWDWITCKIVNGTIHNPHYYQFLQQNGGVVPRAPGDVVCGGMPEIWALNQLLQRFDSSYSAVIKFIHLNVYTAHRTIVDVHFRIRDEQANNRYELQLTESRIRYMLNRSTEEEFKQEIYNINTKRDKSSANIRLLELIDTVGTDLFQSYVRLFDKPITQELLFEESCKLVNSFLELLRYYEGEMDKKMKLFKQSGVSFQVMGVHDGPLLITDKITIRSYGRC